MRKHTLSYPHIYMHANTWLYRQNLDFVGSKAEKLTLVTGFGNRGLWGAKTSSHLRVSSALGKPLEYYPSGIYTPTSRACCLNVCRVLCNGF